jgi:mannosylfructose-6-phosphate phosphatase
VTAEYLIVSDVDGTMTGDDDALARFGEWLAACRSQFRLVYNSGRFPQQVRETIKHLALPTPDALIGGVGTCIEMFNTGESISDWPELDDRWDAQLVRRLMADEPRLELQPEQFLSDYKVSYYAYGATSAELTAWQLKLHAAGLRTQMVYSSQKDLDYLPAGSDKGTATAYLTKSWGFSPSRVIVCGDTANDCALFAQGFLGVVVGNALDELKLLDSPTIYHAAGHHAAGVHEGVIFWMRKMNSLKSA